MIFATWLDVNSWLLEMAGKRLLVDPWLVDDLVFGGQKWLFQGKRPQSGVIPEAIDLILLSQGLEDHAHPPTLERLDKSIPVVASANAAKVAQALGYEQVTALAPGETFNLGEGLEIKAVPGFPMGPLALENGYVLRDRTAGHALFYEPHGYHQPSLKEEAPIDVVITPVMDLTLPLAGPIIRGKQSAVELAEWLQPQIVLPTADTEKVQYQGLLISLLKVIGSAGAMQSELDKRGLKTQVLQPQVGKRIELPLRSASAPVKG